MNSNWPLAFRSISCSNNSSSSSTTITINRNSNNSTINTFGKAPKTRPTQRMRNSRKCLTSRLYRTALARAPAVERYHPRHRPLPPPSPPLLLVLVPLPRTNTKQHISNNRPPISQSTLPPHFNKATHRQPLRQPQPDRQTKATPRKLSTQAAAAAAMPPIRIAQRHGQNANRMHRNNRNCSRIIPVFTNHHRLRFSSIPQRQQLLRLQQPPTT